MSLKDMKNEELELMSYTDIAVLYLKENKKTLSTAELFKEICNLLDLSENEYMDKIADFFQSLSTSKDFILLEDGKWDLKENHKLKLNMDDIYDDKEEVDEEDEEEVIEEDTEPDDIDMITNDEDYIDSDDDDDLADLTIVDDEELEE